MDDQTFTQSPSARAAATAVWRAKYLVAVRRCLKTRDREHIAAAILAAQAYRRIRLTGTLAITDDETKVGELFRKRLYGMILGNHGAWANFLVCDIGLAHPDVLDEFRVRSPFKGCFLLLTKSGANPTIGGEVQAFRAAFELGNVMSFTQVHKQEFLPKGERKHHYVLQVLRPEPAAVIRASMVPAPPRESLPAPIRPSLALEMYAVVEGDAKASAPPANAAE